MAKISEVVKLKTGYANFVELKSAFEVTQENADRMSMYRPTKAHRKAFERLTRGLYQPNDKKFYLLSGSYGTGKSHLCLMFANFLGKASGDPEVKGFYENYEKLDSETARMLKNVRKDGQFLVAICDYYSGKRMEDVVLKAIFDACKSKGLAIDVQTEFDEAERVLADWEKKASDKTETSVRDFFEDFGKSLERIKPGLFTGQLRYGLKNYDSESLGVFRAAFKEMMGGIEFQAQSGNIIPIVKNILKSDAFKKRFKGIAIFFDEFGTSVLEKGAYSKDILQGFMETICKNEPNVLFVGCIHKDFKAYADRYSQADAAVMSARITNVDLLNEGIEEIIGAIVETEKTGKAWNEEISPKTGAFDHLMPYCEALKLFPWIDDIKKVRERVLEDIYGVHPMALSCLLKLSSEIGSDARSTFTFFSGDVGGAEGSYAEFIKNSDITGATGKLTMYTVDRLFSFFEKELSPKNPELRDRQRQLVNGYVASIDALRKVSKEGLFDEQSAERLAVLRAILIYQLCQITTSPENIQFGLYCLTKGEQKQVEKSLEYLTKIGALFFRQQSKTYELAVGTGEDPYDLIDRYLKDTELHPADLVDAFIGEAANKSEMEFLEGKQYNLPFSEDKRFKRYFVRAKDLDDKFFKEIKSNLEKNSSKEKGSYEGNAVHVLCESDAEILMAQNALPAITEENATVAVPHKPQPFSDLLLKVKACRYYLSPKEGQKISVQTESRLRDLLESPDDGYLTQLKQVFESMASGEEACWYGIGGKVIVDQPKQSHKPVDILCEELFKIRCRIKHPDLNFLHDDKWRQGKNTALRQAVTMLLDAEKVMIDNGNPDNHGEKRYLEKVLLKGAGALRKTGAVGSVTYFECESSHHKISDDFPVLKELCKRLDTAGKGTGFSVGSFIEEAKSPPYGAGGTALVLALAHAIRAFGERLRIYKDSTKTTELTIKTYDSLADIVEDPSTKVIFEIKDISPMQLKLVEEAAKAVKAPPLLHGESRSLYQTYDALKKWWRELPTAAKIIDLYEMANRNRLSEIKKVLDSMDSTDRFELLLEKIPSIYLDRAWGDAFTEEDVEKISTGLSTDAKLFDSGLQVLRTAVAGKVCAIFGAEGDIVNCEDGVTEWYESLNPAQRDPARYEDHAEAESLMKRLADTSIAFETKVMEKLAMDFGFTAVKDWSADNTDLYAAKWKQAKTAADDAVVVVPPPFIKAIQKAKETKKNYWEIESGGSVELTIPEGAAGIFYTTNGEDPKKSKNSVTSSANVIIEDQFRNVPKIKFTARTTDKHGNSSTQTSFTIINKAKEYDVVIDKKDLYVKEGNFKFPDSFEGFTAVMISLTQRASEEKLINEGQEKKIITFFKELS